MDVRSYRGANIETDHYPVGIKLRARISNAKTGTYKKNEKIRLSIDECEGEGVELLWQNC
jgi:hypothetical protein